MQSKRVKLIAVTGGIGSGKTTAIDAIKSAGYFTLSCDGEISALYKKRRVLKKLKAIFPFAVKGRMRLTVDRKALAERVFSDKEQLKKLNQLMHPLVMERVIALAKKSGKEKAFIEVPLLFESGYQTAFDAVIIIVRDRALRIESVKTRSKLTEKEIEKRIESQFDYDRADLSAYTVIVNEVDQNAFIEKVLDIAKKI